MEPAFRFSIVIPVKNDADHLRNLLSDLKLQTLKPSEIIVASSSFDNTNEIAQEYGANVVPGTTDGRIGLARNLGAKKIKNEVIIFFDSDVRVNKDFLKNILAEFNLKKLDIAMCRNLQTNNSFLIKLIYFCFDLEARIGAKIHYVTAVAGTFMIMKKTVFNTVQGFNENLKVFEDVDIVNRAMKEGFRYSVLSEKIITSSRRYEGKNIFQLLKLFLGTVGLFLITKYGIFKSHQQKFESWYGRTGGSDN